MIVGIDVGTSSLKVMLMEENGRVVAIEAVEYNVVIAQRGWGEQDPLTWWKSLCQVLQKIKKEHPKEIEKVKGIGFSGQMHGLVAVDAQGHPVRNAILWMDQRSTKELHEIEEKIGREIQKTIFHNRVFNGFALPSLLWVKNHEPEIYSHIAKIFQPKDYLRFMLTGEMGTEVSDASAALLLDVGKRQWAIETLAALGISSEFLPELGEASEIAGYVTKRAAKETGLPSGIPVVYGAGDQQAQSIGNGAVQEGMLIANIGTGAQISAFSSKDYYDEKLRTHTFCHGIPKAYTIYGAMLSGGLSLKWLKNQILSVDSFSEVSALAEKTEPGSRGVFFLPYLSGERTPHMNPEAKGMFFGLTLEHEACDLARSVMEGVAYALKDSLVIMEAMGVEGKRIIASGGAAKSPVWLQIQADIFEKEVQVCTVREQACLGACILAGVGVKLYPSIQKACECLVKFEDKIYQPRDEYQKIYREGYKKFQKLYQATKEFM